MRFKIDFPRYFKRIHLKDYLPQETVFFLEKALTGEHASITQPLPQAYDTTCDTLGHASGKSLLQKHQLYPYTELEKAEKRLHALVQTKFPEGMRSSDFVQRIHDVNEALTTHKDFSADMLKAYLHDDEAFYQEQAERSSEFSFMCYFLAHFSFLPFFVQTREHLAQSKVCHDMAYDEKIWPHGHCPYCGSPALLSYLTEKEGKRMNACSTCLGIYRVPRIQCPYCLEEKQSKLTYFTSDTDADCHVSLCKKCQLYIKIVDMREHEVFAPHALLDDFATLTLDILAAQQGAEKGALSLWLQ